MAPGPSFYIDCNLYSSLFIIITPLVPFHIFIYFTIQLTALFSVRSERLTTFPPLGAKYLVECVQVHVYWIWSARDLQQSFCCWFQSPTSSINLGSLTRENCYLLHPRLRLGHNPTLPSTIIKQFSGAVAGEGRNIQSRQLRHQQFSGGVAGDFGAIARGVSYSQSL